MNREECLANALKERRRANRNFTLFAVLGTLTALFGDAHAASIYVFATACFHGIASFWEERVRRYS